MKDTYSTVATSRLTVVGATAGQLVDSIGSLADGGSPNLVGSLASKLGNAGSDIDVHILVDSDATKSTPMMFFLGRTLVDVQYFQISDVHAAVDEIRRPVADLSIGEVALGPAAKKKKSRRLSRWIDAVPLFESGAPIVSESDRESIIPALARYLLESAISSAFLAQHSTAPSRHAAQWRRASVAALELAVLFQGETYLGTKWIWKKARRASTDDRLVDAVGVASSRRCWQRVWELAGLPPLVAGDFVKLCPTASGGMYSLGDRRLRRVGDLLVDDDVASDPGRLPGEELARLLQSGAVEPSIIHERLDGWLYDASGAA